jgi:amino acid transporter
LSHAIAPSRRRIKVRGGSLGAFLCWGVVFADIGTSVYYVPGILYGPFRSRSALFVLMTLFVFVLLCVKYAEVTWRYPEGGGVVNVSSQALHPFAGLLGGLMILVDYFLTAALSALSGVLYLAVLLPFLNGVALEATVGALIALCVLNLLGIKESARTTVIFACLAGAGQVLVVFATAIYLGPAGVVHSFSAITHGPPLTPILLLTGYGAAFLAFSGLESVAQLAPAMREPRKKVAFRAMTAVVVTMAITSPLLTL